MTSDGSPYSRFQRAIRSGNLALIHATAAELPYVPLPDALAILLVLDARHEERFEPAASMHTRNPCPAGMGGEGSMDKSVLMSRPPRTGSVEGRDAWRQDAA